MQLTHPCRRKRQVSGSASCDLLSHALISRRCACCRGSWSAPQPLHRSSVANWEHDFFLESQVRSHPQVRDQLAALHPNALLSRIGQIRLQYLHINLPPPTLASAFAPWPEALLLVLAAGAEGEAPAPLRVLNLDPSPPQAPAMMRRAISPPLRHQPSRHLRPPPQFRSLLPTRPLQPRHQ